MPDEMNTAAIWCERTLIFLGVIFYLFVFPHGTHGDAYVRYDAVIALATRHEWLQQKYPMLGPILSLPLYYLALVYKEPHWWISRFNAFCFLGFLGILCRLLRSEWPAAGSRRRLVLLMLVGTMFSKHVTDYYGEVFTSCLAALSLLLISLNRKGGIAGLAFAAMSSPPTLFGTAASGLRIALSRRRWRYFLAAVGGAALIAAENLLRFGSVSNHMYMNDVVNSQNALEHARVNGFGYPFWMGFLSIWFSFGKGLVFFCSGLLLLPACLRSLPERLRDFQLSALAYVVGLVLIYAKWFDWSGDWFWGPRFFLFAGIPAIFALHTFLEKNRAGFWETVSILAVLTLSVWVGLDGVAFGQNNLELCGDNGGYLASFCWYTPDYSALWRPFYAEHGLHGKQTAFAGYFALVYLYLSRNLWAYLWGVTIDSVHQLLRTLPAWRF